MNKRAIIIDDNPSNCLVAQFILEELGFEAIATYTNPIKALDALSVEPAPDLILLDWMMPGMDGIEFTRTLRQKGLADRAALVFCTAKTAPEDRQAALQAGADAFLSKPLRLGVMRDLLHDLALSQVH